MQFELLLRCFASKLAEDKHDNAAADIFIHMLFWSQILVRA